jgi:4-amino-4-deoxy-L-arabinose transferase-like glycosyltransferase
MRSLSHWLNNTPTARWGIVLFLFTMALYFAGIEARSLHIGQETRNAGIAAELTFSRYWTVPRLNGEYYTVTPPLYYWLTGGSMELFGRTLFGAKLPAVLFGVCAVMGVFLFGRRLNFPPWACFIGGAALATTFNGFSLSRGCFPETLQMALIVWALYGYHAMIHAERLRRRIHWFIVYAALMMLLGLTAEFRVLIAPAVILSSWLAVCNLVCGKYRSPVWYAAAAGGSILSCMTALIWLLSVEKLGPEATDCWRNFFEFRPHPSMNLIYAASFFSPWGILPLLGIIFSILALNKQPAEGERDFLLFAFLLGSLILGIPGGAYAAAGLLTMTAIDRLIASDEIRRILQSRPLQIVALVFYGIFTLGGLALIAAIVATTPPTEAPSTWALIWSPLLFLCTIVLLLRRNLRKWTILPLIAGFLLIFDTYVKPSPADALFGIAAQQLAENADTDVYLYRIFDEGVRGAIPYHLGRRAMILNDEAELKLLSKRGVPILFFSNETPPGGSQTLSAADKRGGVPGLYQINPKNMRGGL